MIGTIFTYRNDNDKGLRINGFRTVDNVVAESLPRITRVVLDKLGELNVTVSELPALKKVEIEESTVTNLNDFLTALPAGVTSLTITQAQNKRMLVENIAALEKLNVSYCAQLEELSLQKLPALNTVTFRISERDSYEPNKVRTSLKKLQVTECPLLKHLAVHQQRSYPDYLEKTIDVGGAFKLEVVHLDTLNTVQHITLPPWYVEDVSVSNMAQLTTITFGEVTKDKRTKLEQIAVTNCPQLTEIAEKIMPSGPLSYLSSTAKINWTQNESGAFVKPN